MNNKEITQTSLILTPEIPIVVGVSGGPDSLSLLFYLLNKKFPLVIATFNHNLRPGADDDVFFVSELSKQLGIPFASGSADVSSYARLHGLSIEEAARYLRYHFLFSEARKIGAQAVAVGHTVDDQAETVLMHFLRGSGISGLKGMQARVVLPSFDQNIPLIRPILSWTRDDTEKFCLKYKITAQMDPTNNDTTYFRNRLRHNLIPILEQYNPQIKQTLSKTAQALQGDYELLLEIIESSWQLTVLSIGNGYVEFDRKKLESQSPAMVRNLFRKAGLIISPGLRDIDYDALMRASNLLECDIAGGIKIFNEENRLYLSKAEATLPTDSWPQITEPFSLRIGLQIDLGNGWVLKSHEIKNNFSTYKMEGLSDRFSAWLDIEGKSNELSIRTVQSGDKFEPLGMPNQSIKIADLFVNLKLPKRLRKNWPILCVNNIIAWIPGFRFSESYKVTDKTKKIVVVEIYKQKGQE
ncbi:MAG: tRNA lysidine(34) synthetase TilS [Chloroflexota bacterium]